MQLGFAAMDVEEKRVRVRVGLRTSDNHRVRKQRQLGWRFMLA